MEGTWDKVPVYHTVMRAAVSPPLPEAHISVFYSRLEGLQHTSDLPSGPEATRKENVLSLATSSQGRAHFQVRNSAPRGTGMHSPCLISTEKHRHWLWELHVLHTHTWLRTH